MLLDLQKRGCFMLTRFLKKLLDTMASGLTCKANSSNSSKKAGFTIIELMVVIAIVNLLSGVAVPKMTDLIEKTRQKVDLLKFYYLRDALNRALYEDDVDNVDAAALAKNPTKYKTTSQMDALLTDSKGVALFIMELHSSAKTNYQGNHNKANTGNMCALLYNGSGTSGYWVDAFKEAGFGAVSDIVTARINNSISSNSSTYTKESYKIGNTTWTRTYPTKPIFVSRALNGDPTQTSTNQTRWAMKVRWSGGNPKSHSLEVFLAPDNGDYQHAVRSRQGTCFSTLGEAGCAN